MAREHSVPEAVDLRSHRRRIDGFRLEWVQPRVPGPSHPRRFGRLLDSRPNSDRTLLRAECR